MPCDISGSECIIMKTNNTNQYVFVGYKYTNPIIDINMQFMWNMVTNIDKKESAKDPGTGLVSQNYVTSDAEVEQFKFLVTNLFKMDNLNSGILKCALVGDRSFLYMHSGSHRHNFFVVKETGKIAVYYFHSPSTAFPEWNNNLIGERMSCPRGSGTTPKTSRSWSRKRTASRVSGTLIAT